jgi:hypothetical protein
MTSVLVLPRTVIRQPAGQDVGPGDRDLAAEGVEESAEQQRAGEVPGRERQQDGLRPFQL